MLSRLFLFVSAAVLVLGLAGCDGTQSDVNAQGSATTLDAPDSVGKLILSADIERVTGLSDVEILPFDASSPTRTGDFNVVDGSGSLVATVFVGSEESWDEWLTDGYSVCEPLAEPLGDEAFVGPNPDISPTLTIFAFRQGNAAILIESATDANGEARLSTEELRAIADIIAARL